MVKKIVIPFATILIVILLWVVTSWKIGEPPETIESPERFAAGYYNGFVMNVTRPPVYLCYEDHSSSAGFDKALKDLKRIMPLRPTDLFTPKDVLPRVELALEYLKSDSEIDEELKCKIATSLDAVSYTHLTLPTKA